MQSPANDPVIKFVESLGLLAERYGMPRIAGRMIGLLLTDGGEHTLDDFAERLRVSKASASTNARLLDLCDQVEVASMPTGGRFSQSLPESASRRREWLWPLLVWTLQVFGGMLEAGHVLGLAVSNLTVAEVVDLIASVIHLEATIQCLVRLFIKVCGIKLVAHRIAFGARRRDLHRHVNL